MKDKIKAAVLSVAVHAAFLAALSTQLGWHL